jgi:hypothetical protein
VPAAGTLALVVAGGAGEPVSVVTDPWTVRGVSPSAGYAGARRAYLVRAQLLHPDRHQGAAPEVIAEAERSMRELNDAWEAVQSSLEAGGQADPPPAAKGRPPGDAMACLKWVILRMEEAARGHGDPMTAAEADQLRMPIAAAAGGRRFERWLEHRRGTLRQAMADAAGEGDWQQVWRVLSDSDVRVVLLLLLDRR